MTTVVLEGYLYVGVSLCTLSGFNTFDVRAVFSMGACRHFPQCVLLFIIPLTGVAACDCSQSSCRWYRVTWKCTWQERLLWRVPTLPLHAPQQWHLTFKGGLAFFHIKPQLQSPQTPAPSGCLCVANPRPLPWSDLRTPRFSTQPWRALTSCAGLSPFCLLQTSCCALFWGSEAPPLSLLISLLVRGLPRVWYTLFFQSSLPGVQDHRPDSFLSFYQVTWRFSCPFRSLRCSASTQ